MRLAGKIAFRFLKSNPGQTLLIVVGIGIGVSVQIFIGSLIDGLQKGLIDKTIGNSPHITMEAAAEGKEIKDYEELLKRLGSPKFELDSMEAVSDHPAFIRYEENNKSLLVRGFDFGKGEEIYDLQDKLTEGKLPENKEILLGRTYQEKYGISVGDDVTLTSTKQKMEKFKVSGFFDLKVASLNESWGIIQLETAQSFFDTAGMITAIEIQVPRDKVFLADTISEELRPEIKNDEISIKNWKVQNEQLLSGLQGQSISSLMIQIFVLISVVLGIASVLAITVMQKSKQIGILKAMGLKNTDSSLVFLFEGLFLGVLGALTGILFGLLLSYSFTKFALNPDGTPVIALYIRYSFILGSGVIAIISSVVASLIPARKSSKLNPIDIIRNN